MPHMVPSSSILEGHHTFVQAADSLVRVSRRAVRDPQLGRSVGHPGARAPNQVQTRTVSNHSTAGGALSTGGRPGLVPSIQTKAQALWHASQWNRSTFVHGCLCGTLEKSTTPVCCTVVSCTSLIIPQATTQDSKRRGSSQRGATSDSQLRLSTASPMGVIVTSMASADQSARPLLIPSSSHRGTSFGFVMIPLQCACGSAWTAHPDDGVHRMATSPGSQP